MRDIFLQVFGVGVYVCKMCVCKLNVLAVRVS